MPANMDRVPELGERLRAARKKRFPKDNQTAFAMRIGVSVNTYNRMEQGYLSVALRHYREAARVLNLLATFEQMFVMRPGLFDE